MATPNDHELNEAHLEPFEKRAFLQKAEAGLSAIRSGLLLAAQNGFSARDIQIAAYRIELLESEAAAFQISAIAGYGERLRALVHPTTCNANAALDVVASAEASLLQISLRSDDFLIDLESLVESSFRDLTIPPPMDPAVENEELDVDDETLEIFQEEAAALLTNIRTNLGALAFSPADTGSLWEIRRNAHTFKGAAGIVGLKPAANLAHRIEDLLDKMVASRRTADKHVVDVLFRAIETLTHLSCGTHDGGDAVEIAGNLEHMVRTLSEPGTHDWTDPANPRPDSANVPSSQSTPSAPIVRVSLARLDEIIILAQMLTNESVSEARSEMTAEILQRLQQLRLVRFGTIETRLSRAVHVTCQDENKLAELTIDGADIEVDTQIIDALIEPLIHLLKNGVVHGIESAEVRRLLGKPEKGRIHVSVGKDESNLRLEVTDDGSGIDARELTKKAIEDGIITDEASVAMTERAVTDLIFRRGLTTAKRLNLNAGRGVGMSIIRESIEDRGGSVSVTSEPQKGTTFHVSVPLIPPVKKEASPPLPNGASLVLIVDDSDSVRRQMAKYIEQEGVTAITAADAAEALELLLNGLEPVLILSDVEMPNMNGWEFLEYVKSNKNFGHVPMVMVTSLDADRYRDLATRLGASDYIVKPFEPNELARVLEKFCSVPA